VSATDRTRCIAVVGGVDSNGSKGSCLAAKLNALLTGLKHFEWKHLRTLRPTGFTALRGCCGHPQVCGRSAASPAAAQTVAHSPDSSAACSSTVSVAFSCLSGGYPYFRRMRLRGCEVAPVHSRAASSRSSHWRFGGLETRFESSPEAVVALRHRLVVWRQPFHDGRSSVGQGRVRAR
jgi:hypothetical protein